MCSADSKSNSSIRFPLTTATRVSSGWRASISMRMDIEYSPVAPAVPLSADGARIMGLRRPKSGLPRQNERKMLLLQTPVRDVARPPCPGSPEKSGEGQFVASCERQPCENRRNVHTVRLSPPASDCLRSPGEVALGQSAYNRNKVRNPREIASFFVARAGRATFGARRRHLVGRAWWSSIAGKCGWPGSARRCWRWPVSRCSRLCAAGRARKAACRPAYRRRSRTVSGPHPERRDGRSWCSTPATAAATPGRGASPARSPKRI